MNTIICGLIHYSGKLFTNGNGFAIPYSYRIDRAEETGEAVERIIILASSQMIGFM